MRAQLLCFPPPRSGAGVPSFLLPAGGGSAGSSLLRTPTCAFLGTGPTGLPSPPRVEISGRDRAPQLPLPVPPAVPQQHAFLLQPSPTAGTVTPDKADSEHEPKKKNQPKNNRTKQTNKKHKQTNKQTTIVFKCIIQYFQSPLSTTGTFLNLLAIHVKCNIVLLYLSLIQCS